MEQPATSTQDGLFKSSLVKSEVKLAYCASAMDEHYQFELTEFYSGWAAALINISITFPINKIMFRQMLHGIRTDAAVAQLRREGILYLYRGILPPLCQKTVSVSLMFGLYEQYKHVFAGFTPQLPVAGQKAAAAWMAGCTEAILTPFERIQTLLQDKVYHSRFRNTLHAFQELRPHGLTEYYRGTVPIIVRNGTSNVLFFALREEASRRLPVPKTWYQQITKDFLSGAAIGAFLSTTLYPLNVVKTHMQSQIGGPFTNSLSVLKVVLAERGGKWRSVYRGVHINLTRAFLSWGIINASYEMFQKLLYAS